MSRVRDQEARPRPGERGEGPPPPARRPSARPGRVNPFYVAALGCSVLLPLLAFLAYSAERRTPSDNQDGTWVTAAALCLLANAAAVPALIGVGFAFRGRYPGTLSAVLMALAAGAYPVVLFLELVCWFAAAWHRDFKGGP